MEEAFGVWELFALLGAVQGAFLAFVLWTHRRGRRLANRLLGTLLLAYSLHLLHIVLYWTQALQAIPHFWGSVWMFPYLYGVLLYLYARALTEPSFRLRPRHAGHFVPFLVATALFTPFYLLGAEAKRIVLIASYEPRDVGNANPFVLTIWAIQFVHFALYLWSCRRLLKAAAGRERDFVWLRRLTTAFAVSFGCWFVNGFAIALGLPYESVIDYGATFAMTITIYAIGYTALRQPEIFVGGLERDRPRRYEKSSLKPLEAARYEDRLLAVMRSRRPYKDAELKLEDLAGLLEMSPHDLSQVINQRMGQNFNEFVNRYRVEEAKRLLAERGRERETLLSLAFEAGFNNKTSFNEAFKKYTRMTPSRFRASLRERAEG